MSITSNENVSGTPSATPDAPPKLDVMSLRTTPDCSRMSGPFVPSAGYGPFVSSGISSSDPAETAVESVAVEPPLEQAAIATAPAPAPSSDNKRRRVKSVPMSNCRPWSTSSASGSANGRPS